MDNDPSIPNPSTDASKSALCLPGMQRELERKGPLHFTHLRHQPAPTPIMTESFKSAQHIDDIQEQCTHLARFVQNENKHCPQSRTASSIRPTNGRHHGPSTILITPADPQHHAAEPLFPVTSFNASRRLTSPRRSQATRQAPRVSLGTPPRSSSTPLIIDLLQIDENLVRISSIPRTIKLCT